MLGCMRLGWIVVLGGFAWGCVGNGGGEEGDGTGDLVGDWFICDDPNCESIDDDGVRFTPDGTWLELDAEDQILTGEPVCVEVGNDGGGYTWDGEILGIVIDSERMGRYATLMGDRLHVSSGSGEEAMDLIRVKTYEELTCPDLDGPPSVNPVQDSAPAQQGM